MAMATVKRRSAPGFLSLASEVAVHHQFNSILSCWYGSKRKGSREHSDSGMHCMIVLLLSASPVILRGFVLNFGTLGEGCERSHNLYCPQAF